MIERNRSLVKGTDTFHSSITVNVSFNTFTFNIVTNSACLPHLNRNNRCLIVLLIWFILASSPWKWINQSHWNNSNQNSRTPGNEHTAPAGGCHKYNASFLINNGSLSHIDQCHVLTETWLTQRGRGKGEGGDLQKLLSIVCLPRSKLTEN